MFLIFCAFQADLRAQYDKEQELYQNKSLLSKESKDKLEVNFMYEPPPGKILHHNKAKYGGIEKQIQN